MSSQCSLATADGTKQKELITDNMNKGLRSPDAQGNNARWQIRTSHCSWRKRGGMLP